MIHHQTHSSPSQPQLQRKWLLVTPTILPLKHACIVLGGPKMDAPAPKKESTDPINRCLRQGYSCRCYCAILSRTLCWRNPMSLSFGECAVHKRALKRSFENHSQSNESFYSFLAAQAVARGYLPTGGQGMLDRESSHPAPPHVAGRLQSQAIPTDR